MFNFFFYFLFFFYGLQNAILQKMTSSPQAVIICLILGRKKFQAQGGFHKLMLERQEIHRKIHRVMSGGTVWYSRKYAGSSHQKGTGPITAIQLIPNSNRQYDRHARMAALHSASGIHLQK